MEAGTTLRTATTINRSKAARIALRSRTVDSLEETELALKEVPNPFSAKGDELVQVLIGLSLIPPQDAAADYYRSRPFMLTVGITVEEALLSGMGLLGGPMDGRDAGVMFNQAPNGSQPVFSTSGDVGKQFTPAAESVAALISDRLAF